jgi:hypothetical protein
MDDKEHTYTDGFPRLPFGLTVVPWIIWALIVGFAIGGALYASKAVAQPVVVHSYEEPGKVSVRLLNGKCVDEAAVMILLQGAPQYFDRAKSLESLWLHTDDQKLHPYGGCWFELSKEETGSEAVILMVFADGQRLMVPKTIFTKKRGQVGV